MLLHLTINGRRESSYSTPACQFPAKTAKSEKSIKLSGGSAISQSGFQSPATVKQIRIPSLRAAPVSTNESLMLLPVQLNYGIYNQQDKNIGP